jgi:hypothetical protein
VERVSGRAVGEILERACLSFVGDGLIDIEEMDEDGESCEKNRFLMDEVLLCWSDEV